MIKELHILVTHIIIGDFIWCSYTYLGENGGRENFPYLMNESSDFTVIGDVNSAAER